jgi:hypothetical protein
VLNNTPSEHNVLIERPSRGVRIWSLAEQLWGILAAFAVFSSRQHGHPKTITYEELASLMGKDSDLAGHMLSRPLELIGRLCLLSGVPPLNVIVVSRETGGPGAEVLLRIGSTVEQDQLAVADHDWFRWRPPSGNMFRIIWETRAETNPQVCGRK